MCGIFAHLGIGHSVKVVLKGLRQLEYRGYDSAGISYIDRDKQLHTIKKEGKIQQLEQSIGDLSQYDAFACIGHIRWATHGNVSESNAHPHTNGHISIVHNGIIENFDFLKNSLTKKNRKFYSQTDSEIILALVEEEREKGKNMAESIVRSLEKLQGNSAIVVLDRETGDLFACKKGIPLVCGNGANSEALISSDPHAFGEMAQNLYFFEDNVLCHISSANKDLINFYEFNFSPSTRWSSKKQNLSLQKSDKGHFEHFMLKEIYEQPQLINDLIHYYFEGEGFNHLFEMASLKPKRFVIAACGTAYYAGMMIKNFFEYQGKIPCIIDLASEFRYRPPLFGERDIGLFVSQSGETADTLGAQLLCKKWGIQTISIVNVEDSTLYRNCDKNLIIKAGVEIGVASTKAFTQQVLTGYLLYSAVCGQYQNLSTRRSIQEKFYLLSLKIRDLLDRSKEIEKIVRAIHQCRGFFFTARGCYYPVALEGALKLKEIAYVHAEGYAAGELKHGPMALIDDNIVNIAIIGPELIEKLLSNVQEVKARKGLIVVLGPEGNKSAQDVADYFFPLDFEGLEELSPIYVNIVHQLLAYYMAKLKGTDIDQPRNLAKSVTVE